MRFACDTGGTFTDLIVEDDQGALTMYKASTDPSDPVRGVINALNLAAEDRALSLSELLAQGEMLIHGTTHAINAIITGNVARTAFLTTAGHPDVLVLREGGRIEPFNFLAPYPEPYVPRALTFEVHERINSAGDVHTPLDETETVNVIAQLKDANVEAVAVCLLWSIYNPDHELRVGQLLKDYLPGVPYTLSHQLNPALREYRRASSTAIDASLKPLMGRYLGSLTERLTAAGFGGRTLVLTSQGGVLDAADLSRKPIHAINSGPSMAPIAGRHYASLDSDSHNVIIADAGGTTYDVSLVRDGRIPLTKETWIGQPFRGHMTGFPSIDIRSIGAGGGSIAWVDAGGLLHVGPRSAGAVPGPVCYGSGGTEPTVTDACLVLGLIDPAYFLGGTMKLDADAANEAISKLVAEPLGLELLEAAAAILSVATENMVQAISDITVNQGIDPADLVLIGGGGAAGLNSVQIARRLGCPMVIIPETGAGLSASGALMSDLTNEYRSTYFTTSKDFAGDGVNQTLEALRDDARAFIEGPGSSAVSADIEYAVEARYAAQVWEIEVPLPVDPFVRKEQLDELTEAFHAMHERIFAVRDPGSVVEFVSWSATARCQLRAGNPGRLVPGKNHEVSGARKIYLAGDGKVEATLYDFENIPMGQMHLGPAVIESPFTTVVADARTQFEKSRSGSLLMWP